LTPEEWKAILDAPSYLRNPFMVKRDYLNAILEATEIAVCKGGLSMEQGRKILDVLEVARSLPSRTHLAVVKDDT